MMVLLGLQKDLFGPGACRVATKVCVWGVRLRAPGENRSTSATDSQSLQPSSPPGESPVSPPPRRPPLKLAAQQDPKDPTQSLAKDWRLDSEATCLSVKGTG